MPDHMAVSWSGSLREGSLRLVSKLKVGVLYSIASTGSCVLIKSCYVFTEALSRMHLKSK